jgi:putative peptidoglycan lipid II flippase
LIAISLATALYPKISDAVARNDLLGVRKNMSLGIRTIMMFTVFFAFVFFVIPIPVVKLLLPSADQSSLLGISVSLMVISFKLVPMGIMLMLNRTFLSFEDAKSVFIFSVPDVLLQIAIIILSIFIVPPDHWVPSICFASMFSSCIATIINFWGIKKHLALRDGNHILKKFIRMFLAGLIMGLVVKLLTFPFGIDESISWFKALWASVLLGGIGLFIYGFLLRLMKVKEINFVTDPLRNIFQKRYFRK